MAALISANESGRSAYSTLRLRRLDSTRFREAPPGGGTPGSAPPRRPPRKAAPKGDSGSQTHRRPSRRRHRIDTRCGSASAARTWVGDRLPGSSASGTKKEIASWLDETEQRCPVTDNVKADTNVVVVMGDRRQGVDRGPAVARAAGRRARPRGSRLAGVTATIVH